jgi:DNA-binding NarL/FixJ family response regulator
VNTPTLPVRILTIDDHAMLREGIGAMLESDARFLLVGSVGTAEAGLDMFPSVRPDITLMDLQMPGMGGVGGIKALRSRWPAAKVVVLTTYRGDANAQEALSAGASGYLLKSALREELIECLLRVHHGDRYISSEVCADIASHLTDERLTPREKRILVLVAEGFESKRIAETLGISPETVKSHLGTLFGKLGAHNRSEAILIARRRGMLMDLDRL